MKKEKGIATLQSIVARIPALLQQEFPSEAFEKWRRDARAVLKYVFKMEPSYEQEFNEISYALPVFTSDTPSSAFEEAFHNGLQSARAMLLSRIDEIREFWPDGTTTDEKRDNQDRAEPNPNVVFVV